MKTLFIFISFIFWSSSWANTHADREFLHCVEIGNLECVKTFIKNGALLSTQSTWGEHPLHIAIFNGRTELAEFLINEDSSIEALTRMNTNDLTPFHIAASQGNINIMNLLIKKHPHHNYITNKNYDDTPLHWAAFEGNLNSAQFLIEKNPTLEHVTSKDSNGHTPLHWAASRGHLNIVKFLIEKYPVRTHIMVRDNWNNTPLHLASENKHLEVITFLMKVLPLEEHILAQNNKKITPIEVALAISKNNETARIIFGNTNLKIKKRMIKICQENRSIDQQVCEQFAISLERELPNESGGYQ